MIDYRHMEPLMAAVRAVETNNTDNYSQVRASSTGSPAVGAYGFPQDRWPLLAAGAGLGGADWRSREAQDYVAGFWMDRLYQMYGMADLVATAWIGGTRSADTVARRGYQGLASITNGVIRRYVEKVQEALGRIAPEGGATFQRGQPAWIFPVAGANQWSSGDFLYHRTAAQIASGKSAVHEGIDIFAERGTPVLSPVQGTVVSAGTGNIAGHFVKVRGDDGVLYYFAHLDSLAGGLSEGQRVGAATYLGTVGNTGNAKGTSPHVHFTMKQADSGNLINPTSFLQGAGNYGAFTGIHRDVSSPWRGTTSEERATSIVSAISDAVAGGTRADYRQLGTTIADPLPGDGSELELKSAREEIDALRLQP